MVERGVPSIGVQQKIKRSQQNIQCGGCNEGFGITTGSYLVTSNLAALNPAC